MILAEAATSVPNDSDRFNIQGADVWRVDPAPFPIKLSFAIVVCVADLPYAAGDPPGRVHFEVRGPTGDFMIDPVSVEITPGADSLVENARAQVCFHPTIMVQEAGRYGVKVTTDPGSDEAFADFTVPEPS